MIKFALVSKAVLSVCCLALSAQGADLGWKQVPCFGGGYVQNVLFTSKPGVLYTYADVGGPYRSDDGGRTWRALHGVLTWDQRLRCLDHIRSMSVDPRNPDSFVTCGGDSAEHAGGVAVSRDGGKTWRQTLELPTYGNGPRRPDGFVLARDPNRPDRLVCGDDWVGVYVSNDNGETWQARDAARECWISDIRFDRVVPGRIYVCAMPWEGTVEPLATCWSVPEERRKYRRSGFFRSDDGGETWRKLSDDAPAELMQLPGDGAIVGNFLRRDLKRSTDGGESWESFDQGLPGRGRKVKGVLDTNTFYAFGAGRGFYLAGNGLGHIYRRGREDATWARITPKTCRPGFPEGEPQLVKRYQDDPKNVEMLALCSITVDPKNDEHWFATDWFHIWETTDAGCNWISRVNGIAQVCPHVLAFDPFDAANIHYGVADVGYYVSNDGGRHWRQPCVTRACSAFAVSHVVPGLLLAPQGIPLPGSRHKVTVRRSWDAGRTWDEPKMEGLPALEDGKAVYTLAAHPVQDVFYAGVSGPVGKGAGGIYRSFDRGETWEWFGEGLPEGRNFFQPSSFGHLADCEINISKDGSMILAPAKDWGLWRRGPSDACWSYAGEGRCDYWQRFSVAADPFVSGRFLSGHQGRLRETLDGGKTWHDWVAFTGVCSHVAFDFHVPGQMALSSPDGVRLSRDGGRTFELLSDSMAIPTGTKLYVALDRGRLYRLTLGSGVYVKDVARQNP